MLIGQLDQFPQKIRDGNFDILLVRPRGTLFQVIASDFALRRIARVLQGSIVLVYALSTLTIHWTVLRGLVLVVSVPSAIVIFSSIWVVGACIAFWTTDGGEFTNAFTYGGTAMAQYPFDIYATWLRRLLGFVIPLAFVCYFPALYVLGKPDPLGLPRFLEFCSPAVAAAPRQSSPGSSGGSPSATTGAPADDRGRRASARTSSCAAVAFAASVTSSTP